MNKFIGKLRRSSPAILTCLSVVGVVGTSVMAVRATPKALQLIKDKKDELDSDRLKLMEVVQDADDKIHAEMAKDAMVSTYDWGYQVYNMDMDSESERLLFYDLASKKYFRTTMAAVLNAQYHVNRNLSIKGDCSLNEYLSFLGVEGIDGGDELGWDITYMVEEMNCYWLDFDNYKSTLEDGLECIIIDTMAVNKFE